MYNKQDILNAAMMLGINFDKFTLEDLITGVNIELEHGTINPKTNVTNNDLIFTMKIALAHLNEFPNYYNKEYGLPIFEKYLKKMKTCL
ncbi:MAG: hypothetical protein PHD03_00860 [Bacilli bacterium]|nr:hypothetical protein [Bacilli bacterium]MDD4406805.1 hypothetical protein [Bacilli bacterium]